jgi:excisionase family DNA binding protein
VPEQLVEAIAQRAAQLVQELAQPEPWIGVQEAAEHLSCPRSRIYRAVSARAIPYVKDGSRVLFRRSELDAWVREGGWRR